MKGSIGGPTRMVTRKEAGIVRPRGKRLWDQLRAERKEHKKRCEIDRLDLAVKRRKTDMTPRLVKNELHAGVKE